MSFLALRQIGKSYPSSSGELGGSLTVLDGINLTVERDEFVALVGETGCGKTTLLHIVAGLTRPTRGWVDRGVGAQPGRDPVGMVFQSPALLPWCRVEQNVLLGARLRGMNTRALRGDARSLLRCVGLEDFRRAYPRELSGGMRQMVALCRALLLRPSLLLMDEPFGALDAITRERLDGELAEIWAGQGTTTLFVTHSLAEAVLLSDRVVVLTARPAVVAAVVNIDLPRPRGPDTLELPRFFELETELRALLRSVSSSPDDGRARARIPA